MKITHYFSGQNYILRSPLSVEQVKQKINHASGSSLWPFSTGVVGGVYFGRLRLQYRGFPLFDDYAPRLAGHLYEDLGGTIFRLKYRAQDLVIIFLFFWYLILTFISFTFLAAYISGDEGLNREAIPVLLLLLTLYFVAPIGMHLFGTRNSDQELDEIQNFLEREVQASLDTSTDR